MAGNFDPNNFSTTPFQIKVDKPWGYEIIYSQPEAPFAGKILHVKKGQRLSLQYHDQKTESLCLFAGKAIIMLENKQEELVPVSMEPLKGYFVTCGQTHRIIPKKTVPFWKLQFQKSATLSA